MSIRQGTKGITPMHDGVCRPNNVMLLDKQLHGTLRRDEQSRLTIPHRLHGRALNFSPDQRWWRPEQHWMGYMP